MSEYGDYIKETKRILWRYRKMQVAVVNLADEIADCMNALENGEIAIAKYGNEFLGGTTELTSTEASAAKRERMQRDIEDMEERKGRLESKIRRIDRALSCLSLADESLVRGRYIDGYSWREVADRAGYTEKWAQERGWNALQDVALMLFGVVEGNEQIKLAF